MSNFFKIRVSNSKTKFTTYSGEIVDGVFKVAEKLVAELPTEAHTASFAEHKVKCGKGECPVFVLASPVSANVGKTLAVKEDKMADTIFATLNPVEEVKEAPKKAVRKPRKPRSKVVDPVIEVAADAS